MEARRQRIIDLHCAGVNSSRIAEVVGCSRKTVYNVADCHKAKGTLKKAPSGPPGNKKRMLEFLASLEATTAKNPRATLNKITAEINVCRNTVKASIKDLGMKSRVQPSRQLLTDASQKNRWREERSS